MGTGNDHAFWGDNSYGAGNTHHQCRYPGPGGHRIHRQLRFRKRRRQHRDRGGAKPTLAGTGTVGGATTVNAA